MINKTDLRIRNSVSYKGEVWKVEELSDTAAHLSQHPLWVRGHYDNLHPIPITEEALVKMNIAKVNGYPYRFLDGYIKIRNGNYFFKYYNLEIPLDSIHQLQNLYYTLTQTELTYEPTH